MLNIVNKVEKKLSNGENSKTIEKLNKNYQDKIKKLENGLINYFGGNDFKSFKNRIS